MGKYPERVVCLAAEAPTIMDELGALDRVVGISAYTTHPTAALEIPKVSGFQHGSVARIMDRRPDVVILTSSVQQQLAAALGEAGATVLHLAPHRLEDLYRNVRLLGGLLGESSRATALVDQLASDIRGVEDQAKTLRQRPRVYFEEWMDPLIAGIGWVSDLLEVAGGTDVFRDRAISGRRARDRVVRVDEWVAVRPDLMFASWCGKPFEVEQVRSRPGSEEVPAVVQGRIHEVDASILQCGPLLVERLWDLHGHIKAAAEAM